MGVGMTPYRRLLESDYGPDVNNRTRGLRVATDGSPLPNARFLSNYVTGGEGKDSTSTFMSIHLMQMGQFIDHDIAHTPNYPSKYCCENPNEQCIPIEIPSDDPFFSFINDPNINKTCMPMARSMVSLDLDCSLDKERQQVILRCK